MKVRIASPLLPYTKMKSIVEASGSTVEQVTRDLDRQFPGIRFRMIDEQDQIRQHVKFFVNRVQVKDLKAAVGPADEVAIIQAFSGG